MVHFASVFFIAMRLSLLQRCVFHLAVLLCLVGWPAFARFELMAEEESAAPSAEAELEQMDAVLILDASGSMLLTDPERLRDQGAQVFFESLRPEDRLSIVSFSSEAELIRPLTPYRPEEAQDLLRAVSGVVSNGIYTDLYAAIAAGKAILEAEPRKGVSRAIILLSDGKMDPDPAVSTADERTFQLMEEVIPSLKAADIKIYTLYFSDFADKELLSQLASRTEGLSWFTPSADKIYESYKSLAMAVKKPQVLAYSSKGFNVDKNVEEATFYITRENPDAKISLTTPRGATYTAASHPDSMKWFQGEAFDVITIIDPQVGPWQAQGLATRDSFATVLTNMKLFERWSSNMYAGNTALLQVGLYEGSKQVALPSMTGQAKFAFQIVATDRIAEPVVREYLVDDGTEGDQVAGDGIFSRSVKIEEAGDYKLVIMARSPTFERTRHVPFRVKPPFVALSVMSAEGKALAGMVKPGERPIVKASTAEHSEESHPAEGESEPADPPTYLRVEISPETRTLDNFDIELTAIDKERNRYVVPLEPAPEAKFELHAPLALLPHAGDFKLQAFVRGKGKRSNIREQSVPVVYTHHPSADAPEMVKIVATKKEEPEEPSGPPWVLYILMVSAINAGTGYYFQNKLKTSQVQMTFSDPVVASDDAIMAGIEALRAKAEMTEIDIDKVLAMKDVKKIEATPAPVNEPGEEASPETEGGESEGETQGDVVEAPAAEAEVPQEESVSDEPAEGEPRE